MDNAARARAVELSNGAQLDRHAAPAGEKAAYVKMASRLSQPALTIESYAVDLAGTRIRTTMTSRTAVGAATTVATLVASVDWARVL
ncbi:hypothetical protein Slin14017_G063070 [Septoria linicola]|nr:hypothetical protein Slin14017_G063070 [Septoria linicola]